MAIESLNKPLDPIEEMFSRHKAQVSYVNCTVNLLVAALTNTLGIFEKMGVLAQGSKLRSYGILRGKQKIEKKPKIV